MVPGLTAVQWANAGKLCPPLGELALEISLYPVTRVIVLAFLLGMKCRIIVQGRNLVSDDMWCNA